MLKVARITAKNAQVIGNATRVRQVYPSLHVMEEFIVFGIVPQTIWLKEPTAKKKHA